MVAPSSFPVKIVNVKRNAEIRKGSTKSEPDRVMGGGSSLERQQVTSQRKSQKT